MLVQDDTEKRNCTENGKGCDELNRHEWEHALDRVRHGEYRPEGLAVLEEYAQGAFERQELFEALRHGYAVCYHTARIAKLLHDHKK